MMELLQIYQQYLIQLENCMMEVIGRYSPKAHLSSRQTFGFLSFEHEMVHGIMRCMCPRYQYGLAKDQIGNWTGQSGTVSSGHGKTFMSILFNVFGHTKYTHNLRNGIMIMEPDERTHKIEELSVGDKIIANVIFKGEDDQVKFLARVREISKVKGNNILVKSLEPKGPYGEMYIGIHHVVKILDAEGKAKPKPPSPEKSKSPENNNILIEEVMSDSGKDTIKIKDNDNLVISDDNYGIMLDIKNLNENEESNTQDLDGKPKMDILAKEEILEPDTLTPSIINPIVNENKPEVNFSNKVDVTEIEGLDDLEDDKIKIEDSDLKLDDIISLENIETGPSLLGDIETLS